MVIVTVVAELEALYARLPTLNCKGKCQNCCGPIDMSTVERQRITDLGVTIPRFTGERAREWAAGGRLDCPALGMLGQCTVYAVRPLICRLWGVTEGMECPHGCRPDPGYLTHAEGLRLIGESLRIGGHPDYTPAALDAQEAVLGDERMVELLRRYAAGERGLEAELEQRLAEVRPTVPRRRKGRRR